MAAELVDPGYWDDAPQVRGVTTLTPVVKDEDIFPKCACGSNFSTRCGATLPMLGLLGSIITGPVRNQGQFSGMWCFLVKPYISTHGLHRQWTSAQSPDSSCGGILDPDIAINSSLDLDITMDPSGSICLSDWWTDVGSATPATV